MVLGLIWTLICESGIKGSLKQLGIPTPAPSAPTTSSSSIVTGNSELPPLRVQGKVVAQSSFSGDGIKEALRKWCQGRVSPYDVRIENFQGSFSDGLALCALLHSVNPALIAFPPPNVSATFL